MTEPNGVAHLVDADRQARVGTAPPSSVPGKHRRQVAWTGDCPTSGCRAAASRGEDAAATAAGPLCRAGVGDEGSSWTARRSRDARERSRANAVHRYDATRARRHATRGCGRSDTPGAWTNSACGWPATACERATACEPGTDRAGAERWAAIANERATRASGRIPGDAGAAGRAAGNASRTVTAGPRSATSEHRRRTTRCQQAAERARLEAQHAAEQAQLEAQRPEQERRARMRPAATAAAGSEAEAATRRAPGS